MTTIQWTDETWNPVTGCTRVSEGCRNCYIERTPPFRMNGRKLGDPVQLHPDRLDQPLRWTKPRRVFVNSLSDLFHEDVSNEYIVAVFGVMAVRTDHTFQILTKRPQRMREWFRWLSERGGLGPFIRSIRTDGDRTIPNFFQPVMRTAEYRGKIHRATDDPWMQVFNMAACIGAGILSNVWLGVSVEDQKTADERIPILLQTPAAVRFVSAEPLMGPIDFSISPNGQILDSCDECGHRRPNPQCDACIDAPPAIDWVIVGGESGPGARPCDVSHLLSIVEQCKAAGVPVFVKQLGSQPRGWCVGIAYGDEPESSYEKDYCDLYEASEIPKACPGKCMQLVDRKGGSTCEWPESLRVREWPR